MADQGRYLRCSICPESFEAFCRKLSISYRVLDIPVPHVMLNCTGIKALIGQVKATGMSEHVRVNTESEAGYYAGARCYFSDSTSGELETSIINENIGAGRRPFLDCM